MKLHALFQLLPSATRGWERGGWGVAAAAREAHDHKTEVQKLRRGNEFTVEEGSLLLALE